MHIALLCCIFKHVYLFVVSLPVTFLFHLLRSCLILTFPSKLIIPFLNSPSPFVLSPDTDPSFLVLILCWPGFSCNFNLVALIHTLNCLNCCSCGFFSFGVWVSILHLFTASGSPNNTKRLNAAYNYTVNVMNVSHDCIYSIVQHAIYLIVKNNCADLWRRGIWYIRLL